MNIAPIMYKYAMNIKLSMVEPSPMTIVFPHVEDMVLSSRKFDKLDDAVDSANRLVGEITSTLNLAVSSEKYKMVSEINPKFTGKETISKDWGANEVAKLWIYDKVSHEAKKEAKGNILAIALAQLLEIPGDPVMLN